MGRPLFCILAAVCPGRPLCPSESPQPQPCSDHFSRSKLYGEQKDGPLHPVAWLSWFGFWWESMRNIMTYIIEISGRERRTAYRSVSESGLYALGVHRGAVRGWSPSSRSHLRDGFGTCCCLADYGCGRWWTVHGCWYMDGCRAVCCAYLFSILCLVLGTHLILNLLWSSLIYFVLVEHTDDSAMFNDWLQAQLQPRLTRARKTWWKGLVFQNHPPVLSISSKYYQLNGWCDSTVFYYFLILYFL